MEKHLIALEKSLLKLIPGMVISLLNASDGEQK